MDNEENITHEQHAADESAGVTPTDSVAKDTQSRVEALERSLHEAQTALAASERRRSLERALLDAGAVDLETAFAVAERANGVAEGADAAQTVAALRKSKPFLFRDAKTGSGAAMSARAPAGRPGVERAADEAAATGDRASLLRYMRARRESSK
ncbi:MAG: hypothetical protein EA376_00120 [Phycisphaeraceae bacterium]|nr:MAG: hypothetical protein EA376_00120 [Phycisphaeraceae bacterium]